MIGTNERTDNKSKVKINYEFLAFLGQNGKQLHEMCMCVFVWSRRWRWVTARNASRKTMRWKSSMTNRRIRFTPNTGIVINNTSSLLGKENAKLFLRLSLWTASHLVCSFSYTWTSKDLHIHHFDTHTHSYTSKRNFWWCRITAFRSE